MKHAFLALAFAAILATPGPAFSAAEGQATTMPDFTKGDTVSKDGPHDWTLGPTGARGWIFTANGHSRDARQILVTAVAKGAPAEGVLSVGDVILGVDGKDFSGDARVVFAKAITAAESETGQLQLLRWRAGKTEAVAVKLAVLGTYSATAPHDCPKSKRIFALGCASLAKRMVDERTYTKNLNPIPRALNALALLASGNEEWLPLVKREAQWAADFTTSGYLSWYYGYNMALVGEYVMATGAYWREQSWYYDLARAWDTSWRYQGSPVGEEEHKKYTDWDCSGSHLLDLALPLKTLRLAGRKPFSTPPLDAAQTAEVIAAGRDFAYRGDEDRYEKRTTDQLLAGLSSWSPFVRKRSAAALGKREGDHLPALLTLLASQHRDARYGAIEALGALGPRADAAAPHIRAALQDSDPWVQSLAAEAIPALGPEARTASVSDLLALAVRTHPADPRRLTARSAGVALFANYPGKRGPRSILADSLEGVDRAQLYPAFRRAERRWQNASPATASLARSPRPQVPASRRGMDLLSVVTHELGHKLGLEHSSDRHDVMARWQHPLENLCRGPLAVKSRRVDSRPPEEPWQPRPAMVKIAGYRTCRGCAL